MDTLYNRNKRQIGIERDRGGNLYFWDRGKICCDRNN